MTTKKDGFFQDWSLKDLLQWGSVMAAVLWAFYSFKAETEKQIAITHYVDSAQQQDIGEIKTTLRRLEDKLDAYEEGKNR